MPGMTRWIAGGLVAILGSAGLFVAAAAHDSALYVFGLALFAFALLFIFSQIRQAFAAAARAARDRASRLDPTGP